MEPSCIRYRAVAAGELWLASTGRRTASGLPTMCTPAGRRFQIRASKSCRARRHGSARTGPSDRCQVGRLDGKQIVCHTQQGFVVMDVDGGGREIVTHGGFSPRWSPRDDRIAYVAFSGGIGMFDLATWRESQLIPKVQPNARVEHLTERPTDLLRKLGHGEAAWTLRAASHESYCRQWRHCPCRAG